MRITRIENSTPNNFKWLVRDSTNGLVHGIDSVVQEYAAMANFPATGQVGTIYVDKTTGKIYRYDTTTNTYKLISGDALDVNLTPINYVPSDTGNTQNLNQLVVDPNGDIWIIDSEGDARKLNVAQTVTTVTNTLASNTARERIGTYTNEAGTVVDLFASKGIDVLTTVQPTPTATGNTTNLNTTFKDANGVGWIVDENGDAIQLSSPIFKELRQFHVDKNGNDTTGTGADENPFLTIAKALTLAGQADAIIVNEGVYAETVTLATQNQTIRGEGDEYGGLTEINALNATANGTSVRASQLTVTGNVTHSGTSPLYLSGMTVSGNYTSSSTAYSEIKGSRIQDGTISKTAAGILFITDSLIGNATFNTANSVISMRNVTIDAGDTVTIGAGVIYSMQDVVGNVVIHPMAVPLETAILAQGGTAEQAKSAQTSSFNMLRMLDPDTNANPTKFVTWNETTKRLEISDAPQSTLIETTSLTPVYYNGTSWVSASNTSDTTVAKAMRLSDGSIVNNVTVEYPSHGLDIGEIYYLDSVSGQLTKTVPTSPNYTQQAIIVKNENEIFIDIEQAYVASATDSVTFGTTDPTSPSTTANEGDIYFKTSDGTANGTVISTYVYDKTSDKWVAASASSEITTTSLAPKTGNGTAYVNPTLVSETTLVDEIQLSDGSYIRSGQVTFTGHGLPIHTYFYASATAPYYTATVPTTGWSQQLFYTQDANTIDVLIQEGVNLDIINGGGSNPTFAKTVYVNATSPTTATIFDLNNPPTTNDNTLKADSNNIYIGTDGSTWTYNSTTSSYATYVYPTTTPHGVFAYLQANQSIPNGVVTNLINMTTVSNTSGSAWNGIAGTFTVSRSGWYDINANMFYNAGNWAAGGQEQILINVNGAYRISNYIMVETALTNFYPDSIQTHTKLYLNVGDIIRVQAYQVSGSTKTIGNALYNTFSIVEIR